MAIKSIKQRYVFPTVLNSMMETFREMVNYCISIGLEENISTLKKFSSLHYQDLERFEIQGKYKLTAISQAMGRLSQMKRDINEGKMVKSPYVSKPYLVSCYGFKINNMLLAIPTSGYGNFQHILLNRCTLEILKDKSLKVKSFTLTPTSLSLSIQKEVTPITPENIIGIDRNLRNITTFDGKQSVMYKTNKLLSIKENTSYVVASFRRVDNRVKKHFQKRMGNRRSRRVAQHLHKISKDIVQRAINTKSMIVFEDLKGIRKLYRKGNDQGTKYRRKLNSWSFYELERQVKYKAQWEGIKVEKVDPKRTSQLCPTCGGKCQEDKFQLRKLWCTNCKKSMDRDILAAMNISYKAWSRFTQARGLPVEAMNGNSDISQPIILRVDGSQLIEVHKK